MTKQSKNKREETPDPKRRGLFSRLSSRYKQAEQESQVVQRTKPRPPTAVDEDIFERLCNQCGECVTACPQNIIKLVNGYPVIEIDYSHCTLCGECTTICPTLALSSQQKDLGLRAKVSDTCINRDSFCDECHDQYNQGDSAQCPTQALQWFDGKKPSVDTNKCIGCAQCVSTCFLQAISIQAI